MSVGGSLARRASGVLLHPSSLPGPYGSGDFGAAAWHFIDWLATAGQGVWQILPLNPVGPGFSPYMSPSALAISALLVDLDELVQRGWLDGGQLAAEVAAHGVVAAHGGRIDYPRVAALRQRALRLAAEGFFGRPARDGEDAALRADFAAFCEREHGWLDDHALFAALDEHHGGTPWQGWAPPLAQRHPAALREAREALAAPIALARFVQWCAHRQWAALRRHAQARGVRVIGDVPIFVAPHSVDVWAHPQLFDLDDALHPRAVAGVPPDYFSATGQLWGNPLYRWERHAAEGFDWWRRRFAALRAQADVVRIDHFRGFAGYWEIPAGAPDARGGRWLPGPGVAFFDAMRGAFGDLPIIAEDLGVITDDVTALRERFGLPGMRVLQFAFADDARNPYLPHNFTRDTVVYTGTHDNDTSAGWFASATAHERAYVQAYLKTDGAQIGWDLIHAASQSIADLAIYPMQDVLGLGAEARMNLPGRADGCWGWRFGWHQVHDWHARRLREISAAHGRNGLRWG